MSGRFARFAQQILPGSFAGWTCATRAKLNLSQPNGFVAGDPASIAAEYGFGSGEQCAYNQGPDSLQVQLYVMKDATAAYGEYSYLRTTDMPKADLAEHSSMSSRRALWPSMAISCSMFQVRMSHKFEADLKALLGAIASHAQEGPLPTLWQHLPVDNQVLALRPLHPGSGRACAVLSPGFGRLAGIFQWCGSGSSSLQVGRPGRDLCSSRTSLPRNSPPPSLPNSSRNSASTAAVPRARLRRLFAKRSVTLVAMVTGARSQAEADTLLSQIQTGTQITWNEPAFQFKEPSIEMMIVGSIIGTGTICLFALVAGLAFGGFRLLIKRVLPDKVFDRSSHLQVLQMGLCSKPINSEDFYGITGKLIPTDTVDKNLPDRVALRIFR